ncbi:MAG: phytoene desaturase family protein, partial [Rubrobacter sp.]
MTSLATSSGGTPAAGSSRSTLPYRSYLTSLPIPVQGTTWAGPATPGTAYVLMHHEIGDAGLGLSSWGYPRGGMGAVSDALRSSAEEFGAEVRTDAPVERILQKNGRVTGVVLEGGDELEADIVV